MHARGGSQARSPFPPGETSDGVCRCWARATWAAVAIETLATGRLEAAPVSVTLTVDAARSAISAEMGILVDFGFVVWPIDLTPQSAGLSDQSSLAGELTGQLDLVGKALSLTTTGLTLANSGNWTPAAGQGFGTSAPAQFGFENFDFAPDVETYAALRGWRSGSLLWDSPSAAAGPTRFPPRRWIGSSGAARSPT